MTILSQILSPSNLVTLTSTQTLTNKTLEDPIIELNGTNGSDGEVLVSQGTSQPPVWGPSVAQSFVTQYAGVSYPPSKQPDGFGII